MGELSAMERSTPYRVFIAMAYLALNTSLNMLNRWALGQCARARCSPRARPHAPTRGVPRAQTSSGSRCC
jgi:hypothetical protein